jgi:tetratricopeptide (TPR) repeat protein
MLNFAKKSLQLRAERHGHRGEHRKAIAAYDHLICYSASPEVYVYQVAIGDQYVKLHCYPEALGYYRSALDGFVYAGNFTEAMQSRLKIDLLERSMGC